MATLERLARTPVEKVKHISDGRGTTLRRAGIDSVADLLMHVPRTYIDRSSSKAIVDSPVGEDVTLIVEVISSNMRRVRRNLSIVDATVSDGVSRLRATWFNQPFQLKKLESGAEVALSGKLERFKGKLQMKNPTVDSLSSDTETLTSGRIVPIHPAVGKMTAGVLRRAIYNALLRSRPVPDPVPPEVCRKVGVAERDWALGAIHFPEEMADVFRARDRLVFDELFRLEVALAMRKHRMRSDSSGISHHSDGRLGKRFMGGLPYQLTDAQRRVLDEIREDLAAPHAMHRLLQGEVGSGKTVVAVAALLMAIEGGWQGAVMAPTEVLAEQHYLGISQLLDSAGLLGEPQGEGAGLGMSSLFGEGESGVSVALLTGSGALLTSHPTADRAGVLAAIASGSVDLVIGTHALIQEGVDFHRLGMAVVDEQHRFGVAQRVQLRDKATAAEPDLLIMTATPIPRTLTMTLYGDLDVSVIDEMPPGRSPTVTTAIPWASQDRAWKIVRAEAAEGRQAFVVCPLVTESAKVEATSAVAEYERLSGVLDGLRLGLVHGQLHPRDKEEVMAAFRAGELDVLVATTVIEVGIDVPNATVMVIEDADRFGLSQLHQLRGRVGRGRYQGMCVLIGDPTTDEGSDRIDAMVASNDGFELANRDLAIRGQGTVFDVRQSGVSDLRLTDILRDFGLLEAARASAFELVAADPSLKDHRELANEIRSLLGSDVEWLFSEGRA